MGVYLPEEVGGLFFLSFLKFIHRIKWGFKMGLVVSDSCIFQIRIPIISRWADKIKFCLNRLTWIKMTFLWEI
jgi:hypothetical protein